MLDPLDDLPPTTVITHILRTPAGKLLVVGTTADNGDVQRVVVNGVAARSRDRNFSQWEVELPFTPGSSLRVEAYAEDEAGNVELRPHVVTMSR